MKKLLMGLVAALIATPAMASPGTDAAYAQARADCQFSGYSGLTSLEINVDTGLLAAECNQGGDSTYPFEFVMDDNVRQTLLAEQNEALSLQAFHDAMDAAADAWAAMEADTAPLSSLEQSQRADRYNEAIYASGNGFIQRNSYGSQADLWEKEFQMPGSFTRVTDDINWIGYQMSRSEFDEWIMNIEADGDGLDQNVDANGNEKSENNNAQDNSSEERDESDNSDVSKTDKQERSDLTDPGGDTCWLHPHDCY